MNRQVDVSPEFRDSAISLLKDLRKDPKCMVSVSAEDLICLLYQATDTDTDTALNDVVGRLSFIQDTFNLKKSDRPIGFPDMSEVWGHSYADIAHKWIDNLIASVAENPKKHKYVSEGVAEWSDSFKCLVCGKEQSFAAEDNMSIKCLNDSDTTPCIPKL